MTSKRVDNPRVTNEDLFNTIEALRKEMNERFAAQEPYITFLKDANAARKVFAWVFGGVAAILSLWVLTKKAFTVK